MSKEKVVETIAPVIPRKTRVLAIVIKGRRKTLVERKAIEWQDIKADKMIGSQNKRNGRRDIYCAFLLDPGDNVVDEVFGVGYKLTEERGQEILFAGGEKA